MKPGEPYELKELTPREIAVMEGLARNEPLKGIAGRLGISISSVDVYRQRAQRKLRATDRHDALSKWRSLMRAASAPRRPL